MDIERFAPGPVVLLRRARPSNFFFPRRSRSLPGRRALSGRVAARRCTAPKNIAAQWLALFSHTQTAGWGPWTAQQPTTTSSATAVEGGWPPSPSSLLPGTNSLHTKPRLDEFAGPGRRPTAARSRCAHPSRCRPGRPRALQLRRLTASSRVLVNARRLTDRWDADAEAENLPPRIQGARRGVTGLDRNHLPALLALQSRTAWFVTPRSPTPVSSNQGAVAVEKGEQAGFRRGQQHALPEDRRGRGSEILGLGKEVPKLEQARH